MKNGLTAASGLNNTKVYPKTTANTTRSFLVVNNVTTTIQCKACSVHIFVGTKVEDNHGWNNKPASLFVTQDETALSLGTQCDLQLTQGTGTVCQVSCQSCSADLGWKFIHSPVATQTGKIGLMLPDIVSKSIQTGTTLNLLAPQDALDTMALAFMNKHGILGFSGAWNINGQMLARAWGFASETQRMERETKLRIASVSKSLTAVAILQLVEKEQLNVDSKVFQDILFQSNKYKDVKLLDPRARDITVRHLLHHLGGGWSNTSNDPMVNPIVWSTLMLESTLYLTTHNSTIDFFF